MQDPALNQAMEDGEKSSDDPKIREEYYDRRKAILDEMAAFREAELRLREEIRQGKKEGREEVTREVRKRLLEKGMDFKLISDITGMSGRGDKEFKMTPIHDSLDRRALTIKGALFLLGGTSNRLSYIAVPRRFLK